MLTQRLRAHLQAWVVWTGCAGALLDAPLFAWPPSPATPVASTVDGNRLTYLDDFCDPYYPSQRLPKLVTPQWVGEPDVEVAMVLAIDDMSDHTLYEKYLRPILERLKQIDGRAPVSIMSNRPNPTEPHLQTWLGEGVTIEAHTFTHPCPLLKGGDFAKAANDYHSCIDKLALIPNWKPVAYRMTCYDSINNSNPRFYNEIFNRPTPGGHFLEVSSSMSMIFTEGDPEQPAGYATDPDGRPRFEKYTYAGSRGQRTWVNYIRNYPYPYIIGKLCWEIPSVVPDDWQGQNLFGSENPRIIEDLNAALDAVARKQGIFAPTFHPYDWVRNDQMVDIIDHGVKTLGKKLKAFNFLEIRDRLRKNLLAGQPLRHPKTGEDNGVRLLDIDNDGYLDVVIGNESLRRTRVWMPKSRRWREFDFPVALVRVDGEGRRHDAGVRFGVLDLDCDGRDPGGRGRASFVVRNEEVAGGWRYDGSGWVRDDALLAGLELDEPVRTSDGFRDLGVRLRDLDRDGSCELIVANDSERGVFQWIACRRRWSRLAVGVPEDVAVVDAFGRDAGLRFADLNADRRDDLIFSSESHYAVHLAQPDGGWKRLDASSGRRGERDAADEIPRIVRADGTNNGAWLALEYLWVQNEDTDGLPDLLDRRSFQDLLSLEGRAKRLLSKPKEFPNNQPEAVVQSANGGTIELPASKAAVFGPSLVFEQQYRNLGYWQSREDRARWNVTVAKAGTYRVKLDFALHKDAAGQTLELTLGEEKLRFDVPSTGTWDDYTQVSIGKLKLPVGEQELWARGVGNITKPLIDLRTVRLIPVD